MGSTFKKVSDPFGLKKKTEKAVGLSDDDVPVPEKEIPIREPDGSLGLKRSMASRRKRGGRVSTVLSKSETLG